MKDYAQKKYYRAPWWSKTVCYTVAPWWVDWVVAAVVLAMAFWLGWTNPE